MYNVENYIELIARQEEYIKEGLEGVDISYKDNEPVLQLFLSQPLGLITLLDEQCKTSVSSIHAQF